MTLRPIVVCRLEVMALRVRLEKLAARAFDDACAPVERGQQDKVKGKLAFLLAHVPPDQQPEAYRLVRLGRHVYQRSSDVLHGRVAGMSLPAVVVQEWQDVVERLERLHTERRH